MVFRPYKAKGFDRASNSLSFAHTGLVSKSCEMCDEVKKALSLLCDR